MRGYTDGDFGKRISEGLLWGTFSLFVVVPTVLATDFGGNLAWSQYVAALALLLASALAALAYVGSWGRDAISLGAFRPAGFALTGLLLLLLAYSFIQTIPFSPGLVETLSPGSHHARYAWAAELNPNAVAESFPISIAPHDSTHACALLGIAALVSLTSPLVFSNRDRITGLLAAIAVGGCSIAVLGILRKIDSDFTLWSFQSGGEGAPFGTYLNRNNAAFGINVGIAASLGVLVWRKTIAASLRMNVASDNESLQDAFQWLRDWPLLLALIATSIGLLGIVACGSRGGLLTTFIAGGLTLAAIRRSIGSLRGVILVIAAFGGLAFLILRTDTLGYQSLQEDAFAELRDTVDGGGSRMSTDARISHWPDAVRAATEYLPAGSGLGTYRYAYLPWQKTSNWRWFVHADNLWLEAFVELGLFGVALIGSSIGLYARSLWRLSRSADPIDQGLLATGCYLFVSILFSQCFDFGLIMPANMLMVVLVLPMVFLRSAAVVTPGVKSTGTPGDAVKASRKLELLPDTGPIGLSAIGLRRRLFPIASFVCLAAIAVPSIRQLHRDCVTDSAVRIANKELPGLRLSYDDLESRVLELESLAERSPEPRLSDLLAKYRFQLGMLSEFETLRATTRWAGDTAELYRHLSATQRRLSWRAATPDRSDALNATGATHPAIKVSDSAADSESHYGRAFRWSADSLRQSPLAPRPRYDHLRLEFVHRSEAQTRAAIVQGAELFRNNATLSLEFGQRAAAHGDYATAASLWRRSAEVHPPLIQRILNRALAFEDFPIASMVPNNPLLRKVMQDSLRRRGHDHTLLQSSQQ